MAAALPTERIRHLQQSFPAHGGLPAAHTSPRYYAALFLQQLLMQQTLSACSHARMQHACGRPAAHLSHSCTSEQGLQAQRRTYLSPPGYTSTHTVSSLYLTAAVHSSLRYGTLSQLASHADSPKLSDPDALLHAHSSPERPQQQPHSDGTYRHRDVPYDVENRQQHIAACHSHRNPNPHSHTKPSGRASS